MHHPLGYSEFSRMLREKGNIFVYKIAFGNQCFSHIICIYAGFDHIVDILEDKQRPENMVIMRLWKQAFQNNFVKFTELNPLPILFLYGPEIFDSTTL